ncbi:MAG: IS3 family transposase [Oscillospiraceae bacterium]|nr:IS3 family transposase [Oscillospiraceae bacterium]
MIVKSSPSAKYEIIHEMTGKADNLMSVKRLCEIAGVSRSGYYAWLKAEPVRQESEARDRADFAEILKAYKYRGYDKGGRGIYMRLLRHEPPILMNLKKIYRLMRKYGLKCPIRKANPYRRMMNALKTSNTAPNIANREFKEHGVRAVLLTDITYLKRHDGGFSYLSAIMDAGSKEILAHVVSPSLEVDFVLETVEQLMKNHGSELTTDALLHSDQGSHYTSHKFVELLKNKELRQSMSRRANCWDNAPQESFFGHMKQEIDLSHCVTHEGITAVIDDWINYYNNDRYQWDLAKLSPREYYEYAISGAYPLPLPPPNRTAEYEMANDQNTDTS